MVGSKKNIKRKYLTYKSKKYPIDAQGFLLDPSKWDEDFAIATAPSVKIPGGLTENHWKVIHFIRNSFATMNTCPLVYVACRENNLGLGDLQQLFPTGYLRGACKLAGITYREAYVQNLWLKENYERFVADYNSKTYRIDARGFLLNPRDWDEMFAVNRAQEMKVPLTKRHWEIITYLRKKFARDKTVPTVYETCRDNDIDIEELERLFPDGYHRGAVKIAGLRVR